MSEYKYVELCLDQKPFNYCITKAGATDDKVATNVVHSLDIVCANIKETEEVLKSRKVKLKV